MTPIKPTKPRMTFSTRPTIASEPPSELPEETNVERTNMAIGQRIKAKARQIIGARTRSKPSDRRERGEDILIKDTTDATLSPTIHVPIAQRIVRQPSKLFIKVRFLVGTPRKNPRCRGDFYLSYEREVFFYKTACVLAVTAIHVVRPFF